MSRGQLKKYAAAILTLYKRKDKKIRSVDMALSEEIKPDGEVNVDTNPKPPITDDLD